MAAIDQQQAVINMLEGFSFAEGQQNSGGVLSHGATYMPPLSGLLGNSQLISNTPHFGSCGNLISSAQGNPSLQDVFQLAPLGSSGGHGPLLMGGGGGPPFEARPGSLAPGGPIGGGDSASGGA
ncbi:hypothetical protein AB6A40_011722, partial [Gnathostoma spinigerum]